jgi:hypothetical protein
VKLDIENQKRYDTLHGCDYPSKSGMLTASATMLRSALKRLVDCVEQGTSPDYAIITARIDLNMTTYLAYDEYLRKHQLEEDEESIDEIARHENRKLDSERPHRVGDV